ncbi:hypothetical protein Hanom_Chr01g00041691 [Helianthus anomalus]
MSVIPLSLGYISNKTQRSQTPHNQTSTSHTPHDPPSSSLGFGDWSRLLAPFFLWPASHTPQRPANPSSAPLFDEKTDHHHRPMVGAMAERDRDGGERDKTERERLRRERERVWRRGSGAAVSGGGAAGGSSSDDGGGGDSPSGFV